MFVLFLSTQVYFGMLDALLAAEELPEEYRDRYQVNTLAAFACYFSLRSFQKLIWILWESILAV